MHCLAGGQDRIKPPSSIPSDLIENTPPFTRHHRTAISNPTRSANCIIATFSRATSRDENRHVLRGFCSEALHCRLRE